MDEGVLAFRFYEMEYNAGFPMILNVLKTVAGRSESIIIEKLRTNNSLVYENGDLIFPFSYVLVFPNIEKDKVKESVDFDSYEHLCLFKDDLILMKDNFESVCRRCLSYSSFYKSEHKNRIEENTGLLNRKGTLGLAGEECIDTLPLDYGILEDIKDEYEYPANDAYFTYMTRGCGMNCTFCAVKTLEPTYNPYVTITESIKRIDREFGPKRDLLLMDNNVLRSPNFDQIIDEIKALGFQKGATFVNPKSGKRVERHVDFNQGLDAFLMTEHKAKRLGELAIKPARIAFDHIEDEEAYIKAITLCAYAGIDYMSNYLLYNGEDFTGKGHSYHADTPEDLYYRMHLTMELGENLTKELGRRISIFSFPMRYIPLNNDHRGFIGVNWNAKYLRAFQCMLIPTQGKGIQGRSFFEADFGKSAEEFLENLAMPERLLNKRGHFVEKKTESPEDREERYKQWKENRYLIDYWKNKYRTLALDDILKYIGVNRFTPDVLEAIDNSDLKNKLAWFTSN